MSKLILLAAFIGFVAPSMSQECDPNVLQWFPHQYSCQKYVLCFHGNPLERSCAPGLDFSATELKCMLPADARCRDNYICPQEDDVTNPIFLPDRFDCQRYFVCFRGSPIQRSCAEGLWWDVVANWCTTADQVTCDSRTSNNPNDVETTTEAMTTKPRDPPELSICGAVSHLFSPDTGAYMKSSCIVRQMFDYEQSKQACQDSNMNLFIISDSPVQSTFHTATTNTVVEWYPAGFLWINGRREPTGEWLTSNPAQALYAGIDWVTTEAIDGRTSGDCLQYSSIHTPYRAMGVDCNTISYAICEFYSEPRLNTDVCLYDNELTDVEGNYLKSSCIINRLESHWGAEEFCRDNGMHLFAINNATVQAAFQSTTTEVLLESYPSGHVWINGRQEDSEWMLYSPRREPLYDGLEWLQTTTIDGRTSGDCLKYSQQFDSRYWFKGEQCDDRAWFVCEY